LSRLIALDPAIIAPRQEILDQFAARGLAGELLDPCALTIARDRSHFASLGKDRPIEAAFLGTRSHQAGLDFLGSVLRLAETLCPGLRVTLFQGRFLPTSFKSLRSVANREALPWPTYRQFLERERFHLVLAPLPGTPFGTGRSITKIMDVAAVGAVGLYSDREPFRRAVTHGADGLLLPDAPQAWAEAIADLASNPRKAESLAERGAELAKQRGDPARVRQFWIERLGLTPPASPSHARSQT
jgi:glycosyltransferase involved in cell wall biosynthesis